MTEIRQQEIQAIVRGPIRFGHLLAVLFIALKLTDQINWSWLWVLAPLWIPWAIIGILLVGIGVLALFYWIYKSRIKRRRRGNLAKRQRIVAERMRDNEKRLQDLGRDA